MWQPLRERADDLIRRKPREEQTPRQEEDERLQEEVRLQYRRLREQLETHVNGRSC